MDLRRLNHLIALSEERHFGRAAERVHITQSALSRSIKAAEDDFGMVLFDRGSQEVTCTAAGTFVIARARALMFDSRNFRRDVDLYRDRQMGDLSFGVGPLPASSLAPQLVIEMRQRFPGVHCRVEVNNWMFLLEHLRAEELDFFLADIRDVPSAPDLKVQHIAKLQGGFYVRSGHPMLKLKNRNYAELIQQHGLAIVRLPPALTSQLAKMLGIPQGKQIPIALECDDLHFLRTVAISSDLILAYPTADAEVDVAAGRLHRLPIAPVATETGVVSLKGRSFSPAAQFAVDYLASYAKDSQ